MMIHRTICWLAIGMVVFAANALGQRRPRVRPARPPQPPAQKKEEPKPEKETWLLVRNVELHPVAGPVRHGVDILVRNGKIAEIAAGLDAPPGADVVDGNGLCAYPGLVALNASGILDSGRGKPEDRFNPYSLKVAMALAHGITTIVSGTTAEKLTYGTLDGHVLRENTFLGLFYSSSNPRAKAALYRDLEKARRFLREKAAYEARKAKGDKEAKAPDEKKLGNAKRYLPLLEGKQRGVFNVRSQHEILEACELAMTFGFSPSLRGVTEGWTCADVIGRAGAIVEIIPRERRDPDDSLNRPNGSNIENAGVLYRSGVPVAVATQGSAIELDGGAGADALSLTTEAGFAVRGGLPEAAAVEAVTITAAKAYLLDDRIGSLEVGKDADILLTDGDLLHYRTLVQIAIVNGRVAYDKSKEPLYAHIRPRDPKFKPSGQWWPRHFDEMPDAWTWDARAEARKAIEKERAKKKDKDGDQGNAKKKDEDKKAPAKEAKPADPVKRPRSRPSGKRRSEGALRAFFERLTSLGR